MTDGRCVDRAVSCFHAGLKNMTYLAVCVVAVSCQEFRTQKDARLKAVRVAPDRACDSKGPVVIDDVAVSCGDPGRRGLLTISSRRFFFFFMVFRRQVGTDPNNVNKDRMVFSDEELVCEAKRSARPRLRQ